MHGSHRPIFLALTLVLAAPSAATQSASFVDVAAAKGLGTYDASSGDGHAPGAVFTDLTGDGYADLYLMVDGPNELYVNVDDGLGGRTFVAPNAVLDSDDPGRAQGAVAGDYDNDGDLDLYVINWRGDNALLKNLMVESGVTDPRDVQFADVTASTDPTGPGDDQHGLARSSHLDPVMGDDLDLFNSLSAAWCDVDRDGDIDLYHGTHDGTAGCPTNASDDQLGERDTLYINQGDGTFTDVTLAPPAVVGFETVTGYENADGSCCDASTNFDCAQSWPVNQEAPREFSSTNGVTFADFDNDGWPDLFVTNKSGSTPQSPVTRDMLYINKGVNDAGAWLGYELVTYDLPADSAGVFFGTNSQADMGAVAGDIDNDGDIDCYSSLGSNNPLWRSDLAGGSGLAFTYDLALAAAFSWGVHFEDFDNNGRLDVHVATQCTKEDHLYLQDATGAFVERAAQAGVNQPQTPSSRGNPAADYNRDGWVDFFVVNRNSKDAGVGMGTNCWGEDTFPSPLFENTSYLQNPTAGFLSFKLVGDPMLPGRFKTSRDALSARVTVSADLDGSGAIDPGETMIREITSGSGNAASTCSLEAEFGVGEADTALLQVAWPSGRTIEGIAPVDEFYVLHEADFSPEAHWKLNGNLLDVTARHDGTLEGICASGGGPPIMHTSCVTPSAVYVPGPVGQAIQLDGNAAVSIPSSPHINQSIVAKRTVSVWFYVDQADLEPGVDTQKQVIYEEGGTTRGLNIYVFDGALYVGGWNNDPSQSGWTGSWIQSTAIQDQTWHHVALVLDGFSFLMPNALRAYLDGQSLGVAIGSQLWGHGADVNLGANGGTVFHDNPGVGDSAAHAFAGRLDDARVYNRALLPPELEGMYAAGTP
ncbi:MAG: FG-GAP-like repeat-containing protein [Planctomycetota bacterium]